MATKQIIRRLPSLRLAPLLRTRAASTTAIEHSAGAPPPPVPFMPLTVPQLHEQEHDTQELPVRVPFLPENDFARYHRHEYVPVIKPPHEAAVSTLINSPESNFAAAAKEILSELFPITQRAPPSQAKEKEAKPVEETEEDKKAVEMTEQKLVFLKTVAGGAVAWWAFGEPVMRLFGIL